jgi:hypothetical protein
LENMQAVPSEAERPIRRIRGSAAAAFAACAALALGASAAAAATSPAEQVLSVSQSATTLNANTTTQATITVSVQLLNAPANAQPELVYDATALPGDYSESTDAFGFDRSIIGPDGGGTVVPLKLTSGSDADGTWTGTFSGPKVYEQLVAGYAATYTPWFEDEATSYLVETAALEQLGAQPIVTQVTEVPTAPTITSVSTKLVPAFPPYIEVSFATGATDAYIGIEDDGFAGACAGVHVPGDGAWGYIQIINPKPGACTFEFHLWNSAGRSATATETHSVI